MTENFCGIVLRTIKHSDSLMVADIYTQTHGRMSFLLPVSRSKRTKVRNVLFQPLTILSFTASCRKGKTLGRITDVQPFRPYVSIPYDVAKSSVALYLAEFLTQALREEEGNEALFNFMLNAFSWFDIAKEGYADFHILFLLKLTLFIGIYPNVEDFVPGSYFDLAAGCIVREQPFHGQYLSCDDTCNFIELLECDFNSTQGALSNRKARGEYLTLLQNYYRLHVPGFNELKSADVLRELFD